MDDKIEAALEAIRYVLFVLGDIEADPFGNTAASFKNAIFEVHAYSWGDDDQPFNFKWRDFEVKWYKYLGRGMGRNRDLTETEVEIMLTECIDSIKK